ncbi:MAG: 2'-deoxycytidine 5'-triphosphate deaminase [Nitrospira sp.]|nr:2'-deoxycytidine 5'-triphosphate deaminase [Nitrospira sp.]
MPVSHSSLSPRPSPSGRGGQHGILPDTRLRDLIQRRAIHASHPISDLQIQPASIDLRLGTTAYRLRSSFLPEWEEPHLCPDGEGTPREGEQLPRYLAKDDLVMYQMDLTRGAILEKRNVYLVPLLEQLALPEDIRGRTNPRSSTGRLDIFTRVVTDLNVGFDEIRSGYCGPLYLEIVPRSFTIRVQTGQSLNQLRLMTGRPTVSDSELHTLHRSSKLLYHNDDDARAESRPLSAQALRVKHGLSLRIDVCGTASCNHLVGYRAKKNSQVVDISRKGQYAALDFWEPIYRHPNNTLLLEPEEFYILASKERINVPAGYAAEIVAYEAAFGELRTHYAGFFDPGFGSDNGPRKGTQVVLEVRPHDVPFMIRDGQTFFKVVYEKMAALPERLYGALIESSYHRQGLTLSRHFKVTDHDAAN